MKRVWLLMIVASVCGMIIVPDGQAQNTRGFQQWFSKESARFQKQFQSQSRQFQERYGFNTRSEERRSQHTRSTHQTQERKPRVYYNAQNTSSADPERARRRTSTLSERIVPLDKVASKPELTEQILNLNDRLNVVEDEIKEAKQRNDRRTLQLAERKKEVLLLQLEIISVQAEMSELDE